MATDEKKQKNPKKECFVIGPIGGAGSQERRHADMLLNAVIREAFSEAPYKYDVIRADTVADPGMITDKVIGKLLYAELCVADLSYLNPNVFYELGIRHAAKKPVIHVASSDTELPFDNIGHRAVFFDIGDWHSIRDTIDQIRSYVDYINSEDFSVSNPITQAESSFKIESSSNPRDKVIASLQDRIEYLEKSQRRIGKFGQFREDRFEKRNQINNRKILIHDVVDLLESQKVDGFVIGEIVRSMETKENIESLQHTYERIRQILSASKNEEDFSDKLFEEFLF